MANIPTLQIPNVSSGVGNLSMAPAGAVRVPKIETMPVLGREVFDGVGAGMVGLSRGMWEGAQILNDFSNKMAAANDDFQYAAADRAFSEALAEHEVESSRLSPDKHTELWKTKYLPKLQTQVEGMKVTPDGRARLNAFYQRQAGNSTAAITVEANKKFLQAGLQESNNYIARAVNEGRDEDAVGQLARDVANGVRTKEQAEEQEIKIMQDRKISNWRGYIQQKPAEAVRVFRDAQASGKYPNGLRPEEVMQLRREAEGQHGQLLQDFTNNLLERLETDSAAITDKDIEAAFSDPQIDAPRELKDKLINARALKYADTAQGKAEKDEYYSDLWQKLFAYDAEKDASVSNPDTYMRNYQKLQQEIISTAPEGERKPFLDKLNESVSKAKEGRKDRADQIAAGLTDLTKKLADWGQLGDDGGWKKVKKGEREVEVPQDWNAYGKVQSKRNEITTAVRQMLRENPDLTEEEAYERFKGVLEDKLDGGAKFMQGPDEESWWQKLLPFVQGPYANNPNVMTAGISWGSSSLTEGLDKDEPLPAVQTMPPQGADVALSLPPTKQPIANQITNMATQEGLGQFTPHLMLLVAQESNFNPNTTISTSSARGLFQLLDGDRKRYGSDSTLDGQIRAGLAKTKENIAAARRALGRDPDPFELYVVHYQGIGAGPAILRNPDGDFRATLDETGGKGHASSVIRANKWLSDIKTNQDFIDWVRQRLSKKAADLGMA
jgi:hypothetical protein